MVASLTSILRDVMAEGSTVAGNTQESDLGMKRKSQGPEEELQEKGV